MQRRVRCPIPKVTGWLVVFHHASNDCGNPVDVEKRGRSFKSTMWLKRLGNVFNVKLRLAKNGDIDSNRDERFLDLSRSNQYSSIF